MDLHLYPSALSRDRAVRAATRARGVLFAQHHYTYAELCERLYRAEGLPGRLAEPAIQTVFVRHSLSRTQGEEPAPGLVAEYRGLIDELKGAGLEVGDWARCLELAAAALPATGRQTLHRLLQVWQAYQDCLARAALADQGDRDLGVLALLARHLAAGTRPAWLRDLRRVVVHDIYHLPLVRYAIVAALIKLAADGGVLQHFASGANVDAMRFAEYTWQRFVADESLASLVLPEFAVPRRRGGNLQALGERLFVGGAAAEPLDPDGTLTIVAAPGRLREVESILRRVRELLERGVAPERMAIVVRHLEHYGDVLEGTARRYGVPLWFRRGLPLFHIPLTKTVFELLELADSPYPRQALLNVLTSAYVRVEGAWPEDVVGLVNAAGYLDRRHAPLPQLLDEYRRRRQPSAPEAAQIQALSAWVETLSAALDDWVEKPRSFQAHLEALKALLLHLGFVRALGMQPEVPLHVVQRDREALRLLFDTLWTGAEALRLLGDAPLPFAAFRLLAVDLLREVSLEQPRQAEGAVPVLGVRDVLGLDFDHVFIPGLADAEFPPHHAEHPVLDDAARHALNPAVRAVLAEKFAEVLDRRLLGRALFTAADRAREEPLLFFLGLEAANRSCMLSYPTRTADGEAMFPSIFVEEVLQHFREADRRSIVTRLPTLPSVPPLGQCLEPGEVVRQVAMAWRLAGGGAAALGPLEAALQARGVRVDRLRRLAAVEAWRKRYLVGAASDDLEAAPFGDIGRQVDLQPRLLDPQRPWSPTMLEDLAACPFMFFALHVLQLTPRTEPDYDVSPQALGELAHDILADFFQGEPPRQAEVAVRRMRDIAERHVARRSREAGLGHPAFWQVRCAELLAMLDDLAVYLATQSADAYRTCYREHTLTGIAPCGPWTVWLTGRVDRVAMRQGPDGITGVLVQDFKYSGDAARYRARLKLEALGRTSFQLPVYLYLALEQLGREGHRIAADAELRLEYLLLKEARQKAWEARVGLDFFGPQRPGSLFHGMRQLAEQALAGRFVPRPAEARQTCLHCAYAALCRYWSSGAGMEAGRRRGASGEAADDRL
jgi:hypothetical protein